MRRYYIVSGILLTLTIIDFVVAAPVLVLEKRQTNVDVVHIPEDTITTLGKRVDDFDELVHKLFGVPEEYSPKPESPVAGPSSSASPSKPADGWTDVEQPLPPIPEEPSPVSSPEHAPLDPDRWFDEVWLHVFGHPMDHSSKPEESSLATAGRLSSLPPSGPADGWTDVEQPLSPIPEEPSPVSSPDHASPSPGSLTQSGYELMEGDAPPRPLGPVSPTMSSADYELMAAHAPPNPGPSTESDHETMDLPVSSPVSSTNPDPDSPSGKRRKMEKG